jgi:MFS transporter, AAHS family, 4-hydroxybenzoate transporter
MTDVLYFPICINGTFSYGIGIANNSGGKSATGVTQKTGATAHEASLRTGGCSKLRDGMTGRATTDRLTRLYKAAGLLSAVPVICFVVAMIDGYDTLMLSFVAPLISKEWALTPQNFGKIFAGTYAGAALGAALIGIAADRFGRKTMLLASLLLAGVCTLASAWSSGPTPLMWWRVATGLGLGGAIPTISALTAEHAPPRRRTVAVSRMFLGYPVGALIGGLVTAGIMASIGWRGVLIGGGICMLLAVPLVVLWVSETAGDARAFTAVHSERPLAELVADGRMWGTVLVCAATCLTLLVTYFLVSWTPMVLTLNGTTPPRAAVIGAVLNLGGLAGAWIVSSLIACYSPSLTIASSIGAGAILIGLFGQSVTAPGVTVLVLAFAIGLLVIGAQVNIPALCVYYYPAPVYSTGVGLAMAVGRLGSIVGPLIGGRLMSAHIGWGPLFLLAAIPAMTAAFALAAMPIKRNPG